MRYKLFYLSLFLCCCCVFPFAEKQGQPFAYREYYRQASSIFSNHETTENDDLLALSLFEKVIAILTTREKDDSLLFESYVKGGTLMIGLDRIQKSITWFNAAIIAGNQMNKPRPGFFQPHLYCGRSWYTLGQYDSALYHYKIAENIADEQPARFFDRERLFNMLGAVYYDLGNFKQAVNYFEKALRVLSVKNPDYTDLTTRYKNNIAASLVRLGNFDSANAICDEVLQQISNQDNPIEKIIWHRKASINLLLGAADKALIYLNKVSAYPDRKQITLLNDYANVYYNLNRFDSALAFLNKSLTLNRQFYPSGKNPDLAVTCKIWGDLLDAQGDVPGALRQYQLSVLALANNFTDTSVYSNPGSFGGIFAANTLLESLIAKAEVFEKWHSANGDTRNLEAAINTYQSVFELATYMQNSYDTDEARLLLNKKKYAIHDNPIRLCVQLYRRTGDKHFLEKAFYFDEQNKASVLNENLVLLESKKAAGLPAGLLAEEKNLKLKVTALLLKAAQPADEATITGIQNQVRDHEIELNKLYEKLSAYPAYAKLNEAGVSIAPAQIQKKMNPHSMVLAYHTGEKELTCFWFKKDKWDCFVSPLNDRFFTALEQHVSACRSPGAGSEQQIIAKEIYKTLLQPVEPELEGVNNLVIIPDDELHQLPFESLVNANDKQLGVLYSFCYNYSSNLLFRQHKQQPPEKNATLALAPFANDSTNLFNALHFSAEEIGNLGGKQLLNKEASKTNFLQWLPHYRVLHLATHASAGNSTAPQSYIAFNSGTDSASQYLYSEEIVNLDMDSVQLVYLSACETGYGKLVKGEGMMSLSRAFAYAGCPDIITSLWQADDAATAAITKKFYSYYYNGYPAPVALQKAKTDYLEDPAVDKRKKTPFYWAHLVFVGQEPPPVSGIQNKWIPILAVSVLLLAFLPGLVKKNREIKNEIHTRKR